MIKNFEKDPFAIKSVGSNSSFACTGSRRKLSKETLRRYGKRIGPKLKALMEHFYSEGNHIDVREELALIRAVHTQRQELLSTVMEVQYKDIEAERQAINLAGQIAMDSAHSVITACEKVAKIDAIAGAQQSPHAVDMVVGQINQFIYRIFDAGPVLDTDSPEERARKEEAHQRIDLFEKTMDAELELPSLKSRGTTITPDQQVLAMDDMIPTEPEQ